MITIALHGAEFFAYHGFYPEEQLSGNTFIVDIEVQHKGSAALYADNIANTIDYEKLHLIAGKEMKKVHKLIETVAQAIVDGIKDQFPFVENIKVPLKKLTPPLAGKVAYSSVTISYCRSEDGV